MYEDEARRDELRRQDDEGRRQDDERRRQDEVRRDELRRQDEERRFNTLLERLHLRGDANTPPTQVTLPQRPFPGLPHW